MATQRKKGYFFTSTNDKSRLLKDDKPKENTFRDLLESIPFFKEVSSAATSLIQGLVKKATQAQFDAGTDSDSGGSLYATPSQIKAANDALVANLEAKISGVLYNNNTGASTTGIIEEDLIVYSLPFGKLIANDERLIIKGGFQCIGSTGVNNKNVKVYFGSSVVLTTNMNFDWPLTSGAYVETLTFEIELTRANNTLLYRLVRMEFGTGAFGTVNEIDLQQQASLAVPDLDDVVNFPIDIKMTGEADTAPEVITAYFMTVDIMKKLV